MGRDLAKPFRLSFQGGSQNSPSLAQRDFDLERDHPQASSIPIVTPKTGIPAKPTINSMKGSITKQTTVAASTTRRARTLKTLSVLNFGFVDSLLRHEGVNRSTNHTQKTAQKPTSRISSIPCPRSGNTVPAAKADAGNSRKLKASKEIRIRLLFLMRTLMSTTPFLTRCSSATVFDR